MSGMDEALARLEAAIARVEAAAARNSGDTELELAAELRQAREAYTALKGRTDAVAGRLDAAIGRLGNIVDGG